MMDNDAKNRAGDEATYLKLNRRRCRMDSNMVREPGDFPQSDDLVLVAPSETML